jgi:small subunit ribosomal protein S11
MPGFRSSASVPQPSTSPYMQRQYPNQSARKAFNLHIQSTRNNTILCFTDPEGAPITRVTSGQLGFKHTQRSGYEAGHQTAMRMFTIIGENRTKWRVADLNLVFRGFGLGRDAVHRALLTDEATQIRNLVRQVKDATRIKVGGVRPKKRRSKSSALSVQKPPSDLIFLQCFNGSNATSITQGYHPDVHIHTLIILMSYTKRVRVS